MSRKFAGWASLAAFVVIVGSCNYANRDDDLSATYTASTPAPTYAAAGTPNSAPATTSRSAAPDVEGDEVRVATVTDGDTFQVVTGEKVRVLGIDSCEDHEPNKTPGGAQATSQAEYLLKTLSGGQVTLVVEPGAPNADRDGRLLRYVKLSDGSDFGVAMVGYDHTGIYTDSKGRHGDASREYIDELFAHDRDHATIPPPAGRECGSYPPPVEVDNDDDYVPLPDNDDDDDHHRNRHHSVCGRFNPFC